MKKLLSTIALLITIAYPAASETRELFQNKNWIISVVEQDSGRMHCSLYNPPEQGNVINISVDSNGVYYLLVTSITTSVRDVDPSKIDVVFEIISPFMYEQWTFHDAELTANDGMVSLFFVMGEDPNQRGFISDFMEGEGINMLGNDSVYADWSLNGSTRAVQLLDNCRQNIMGDS